MPLAWTSGGGLEGWLGDPGLSRPGVPENGCYGLGTPPPKGSCNWGSQRGGQGAPPLTLLLMDTGAPATSWVGLVHLPSLRGWPGERLGSSLGSWHEPHWHPAILDEELDPMAQSWARTGFSLILCHRLARPPSPSWAPL